MGITLPVACTDLAAWGRDVSAAAASPGPAATEGGARAVAAQAANASTRAARRRGDEAELGNGDMSVSFSRVGSDRTRTEGWDGAFVPIREAVSALLARRSGLQRP